MKHPVKRENKKPTDSKIKPASLEVTRLCFLKMPIEW